MSTSYRDEPVPDPLADAAAGWVLRHDRGLTPAEQDEFSQWLAADPRHGTEFQRHRREWRRLDTLSQWVPHHSQAPNPDLLAPRRVRPRWSRVAVWIPLAAAAAVAVALWRPTAPAGPSLPATPAAPAVVATAAVASQVLPDGTTVELNGGARLETRFTERERRVLLSAGEAHFTVVKDPDRPFVVSAQGVELRAVGTAFNVRLDSAGVDVLVTEGKVEVTPVPEADVARTDLPRLPRLEAGQRIVVLTGANAPVPVVTTLSAAEIGRMLAWQQRLLEFTAAPLAEVVAEFNRRNAVQIAIADPSLSAVPITASFRSDNIDGFVRLIEVGFGIGVERVTDGEIRLVRRP